MGETKILYGATEFGASQFCADILWSTNFRVADPVLYIEHNGKKFLFASSLEIDRAKREANVDEVVLIQGTFLDCLTKFLKDREITRATVSKTFPYSLVEKLQGTLVCSLGEASLCAERAIKTEKEITAIAASQAVAGRAINTVREFLKSCRIEGDVVVFDGKPVTSELLRRMIDNYLYEHGFLGIGTIVSSGIQSADPHCVGSGPIGARVPIVLDVFPAPLANHYYGDMTRTLFKGEPSEDFKKMYEAVQDAQEQAILESRGGKPSKDIWKGVTDAFEAKGFKTTIGENSAEGFIHGLGHGVGIEIHEDPRVGDNDVVLAAGNVVTMEPGLYYRNARPGIPVGGVRIEDIIVVEREGSRPLAMISKDLGWAVVA